MPSLHDLVRTVLRSAGELVVALLRGLVLLVVALLALVLWLLARLRELTAGVDLHPEEVEDPCGHLPEEVVRRPDPCLYSQRLLRSQGLPVTWNNPDIWIAPADDPGNPMPDSYHLEDDTEYVVFVRVHNASATDPAIGTRVRLRYRPWSFNSPDREPVETDADGQEVVRFAHVAPMDSEVVRFTWHTPALAPGEDRRHFCLQASVFHPMDTNTANNVGQENTNVYRSDNPGLPAPGDEVTVDVPLFNPGEGQEFTVDATAYAVEEERTHELELRTTRGYGDWSAARRVLNVRPTLHANDHTRTATDGGVSIGRLDARVDRRLRAVKHRYTGFDEIRETILDEDHTLPTDMTVTADGEALGEGLALKPDERRDVAVSISIPEDTTPGTRIPVNLTAADGDGVTVGGVTVLLDVREDD